MEQDVFEKFRKAGETLANALEKGKEKIKPGVKLLEITELIEDELIRNKGHFLAFPLNIGINEITAHYACPSEDATVFPDEGLVSLDAGIQVEGFATDMAVSTQFGTEKYQVLIDAAEAGLETAIKTIKAGVMIREIGIAVEKTIRSYGVQPINNLSGHLMTQYELHAGISVPSVSTNDPSTSYRFKEGDIFALEPFATPSSAAGYVKNGVDVYIHALSKRKVKNLPNQTARWINRIWGERRGLPFSLRWYDPLPSAILNRLTSQGILHGYPVLIEASNQPVAQAEKTVIVRTDGCEIITIK